MGHPRHPRHPITPTTTFAHPRVLILLEMIYGCLCRIFSHSRGLSALGPPNLWAVKDRQRNRKQGANFTLSWKTRSGLVLEKVKESHFGSSPDREYPAT